MMVVRVIAGEDGTMLFIDGHGSKNVKLSPGQKVTLMIESQIVGNEAITGLPPGTQAEVVYSIGEVEGVSANPDSEPQGEDVEISRQRLYPQTAREALLELRRMAAAVHVDLDVSLLGEQVERVAVEGLCRTEPINFELTDELADRLAEAHKLLGEIGKRVGNHGLAPADAGFLSRIDEVLALPPTLESMVERRIR